jgi:3'(2'), 5'-bisphosphate nucleotidase
MLEVFERAVLAAGREILKIYKSDFSARLKEDNSPVTEADECAEHIILAILYEAFPGVPIVAEEAVAAGLLPALNRQSFILVDPLDGTKEFLNGRDDFTVNIAFVENGVPVIGIVYAPALGVAYTGCAEGAMKLTIDENFKVTARHPVSVRQAQQCSIAVASRSHVSCETEGFLKTLAILETRSVGSSLKFCMVAEGIADVYPRFGRTMEWDTAAGDAVLRAAGGMTLGLDGEPMFYGKTNLTDDADFANRHFVAWGRR